MREQERRKRERQRQRKRDREKEGDCDLLCDGITEGKEARAGELTVKKKLMIIMKDLVF